MAEHKQVIVSSESGLAQEIVLGKHRLRADEPAPFGTDTGPSPYELVLASLGACTWEFMRNVGAVGQTSGVYENIEILLFQNLLIFQRAIAFNREGTFDIRRNYKWVVNCDAHQQRT